MRRKCCLELLVVARRPIPISSKRKKENEKEQDKYTYICLEIKVEDKVLKLRSC